MMTDLATDHGYFVQVDNLTNDVGSFSYIGALKDITKKHWKPVDSQATCSNRGCRKSFTPVLERPEHCRRCGEIFCKACIQYRRRLNKLAQFDLDGQLYKVCKSCFERDQITDGHATCHTQDFLYFRSRFRNRLEMSLTSTFTLEKECDRLVRGFASSVGKSEIFLHLQSLRSMVSTPDWMKSSFWMRANMATKCSVCQASFGMMKPKKFCRICGLSVCKNCSSSDLIVYFPNDDLEAKGLPKLSIIKIVGCPEVEPEISLYLRVCPSCKDMMIDRQVKASEEELTLEPDDNFLDSLHRVDVKFQKAEVAIKKHMPNYLNIVESLEDSSRVNTTQSNTKALAKAQGDLADVLAQHVTNVQLLKKLTPKSEMQARLLKNYIRAKCEFYMDNMCSYRSLKEKLSKSVPIESLEFIQRVMDKNAIIGAHTYLRQLVYEVLLLTGRHGTSDDLPAFLMRVEQEIEGDMRKSLIQDKEDVEKHLELLKDMIQARLKEHRLLRPSKRHIQTQGSKYVMEFLYGRTEDVLVKVINQLQVMSANRSFPQGKKALDVALDGLREMKDETEKESKEFMFI